MSETLANERPRRGLVLHAGFVLLLAAGCGDSTVKKPETPPGPVKSSNEEARGGPSAAVQQERKEERRKQIQEDPKLSDAERKALLAEQDKRQ